MHGPLLVFPDWGWLAAEHGRCINSDSSEGLSLNGLSTADAKAAAIRSVSSPASVESAKLQGVEGGSFWPDQSMLNPACMAWGAVCTHQRRFLPACQGWRQTPALHAKQKPLPEKSTVMRASL